MNEWTQIGLGFGANLGDPEHTIGRAVRELTERVDVRIEAMSSLYRTPPWGPVAQPDFINACAIGTTDLQPDALLHEIKAVELRLGREASERWGPRAIDIDILFFGTADVDLPGLVIPHQSLFERAFVLIPLAEIAPDLVISGRAIGSEASIIDRSGIEMVAT